MILFWDTETSGLPLELPKGSPKGTRPPPSDHVDQPHIVELAMLLCEEDGTIVKPWCRIVRPDGWTITEELTRIHGITQDYALTVGIPEKTVVDTFVEAVRGRARMRVAHNPYFDDKILRIGMLRHGYDREAADNLKKLIPVFDTCRAATAECDLPPSPKMIAAKMFRPKAPKLEEAYRHFFQEELPDAHSAAYDVMACARIYFRLHGVEMPFFAKQGASLIDAVPDAQPVSGDKSVAAEPLSPEVA